MGAVAELERNLIQERIHMGLQRARKQGKQLGRRRVIVDREKVRTLHESGASTRAIAQAMGLTKSTVHNIVTAKYSETVSGSPRLQFGDCGEIFPANRNHGLESPSGTKNKTSEGGSLRLQRRRGACR